MARVVLQVEHVDLQVLAYLKRPPRYMKERMQHLHPLSLHFFALFLSALSRLERPHRSDAGDLRMT